MLQREVNNRKKHPTSPFWYYKPVTPPGQHPGRNKPKIIRSCRRENYPSRPHQRKTRPPSRYAVYKLAPAQPHQGNKKGAPPGDAPFLLYGNSVTSQNGNLYRDTWRYHQASPRCEATDCTWQFFQNGRLSPS